MADVPPTKVIGKWEVIGQPECPLMARRTLLAGRFGKLLLHEFFATARDRDYHDHPASFLTFVYQGDYEDIQPDGEVDHVHAPAVRFRRARHAHITMAGPRGAKSVVVMGPKTRVWGFIRDGRWLALDAYERLFGGSFRCPE